MSLLQHVSALEPLLPRLSLRMRVVVCTSIALNLTLAVGYLVFESAHGRDPFNWQATASERTPIFIVATFSLVYHVLVLMGEAAANGVRAYRARRRLVAAEERMESMLGQPVNADATSSAYSSMPSMAFAWLVSAAWLGPIGIYGFVLISGRGFPGREPPFWLAMIAMVLQVCALATSVCTATFAMHERRYGARAIYLP
ncbi:hypothetical protein BD626DRAFT_104693 [Schizophyllum amplum]|uniref:Uncharacterized protein n=1 Tax=Schizophyllum amplum TaxID=97359 RepID=A0A550CSC3_9AGAR|nr:hypothetical protein BD626DRAFT_104693 [Auriculariopsis ampla]